MPTQTIFAGTEGVPDLFTFGREQAHNLITGFKAGEDVLDLTGFGRHEIRFEQEFAPDGTPMLHFFAGGFAGFGENHTEVTLVGVSAGEIRGHLVPGGDALFY